MRGLSIGDQEDLMGGDEGGSRVEDFVAWLQSPKVGWQRVFRAWREQLGVCSSYGMLSCLLTACGHGQVTMVTH
jgi:hypothetical protein